MYGSEKLTYNAEGIISFDNANTDEETIIRLTISVLALGIEKLTEKRKEVWGKSNKIAFEEKYADSLTAINSANVSTEKRKVVLRKLIEKTLEPDDADSLLSPFCFVEYASLKHQFASIFS